MKQIPRIVSLVLAITLLLSLSGCGASDGKTHLTFQIWDVFQRPGMQAVCDAYTAQHPDVVIEVQVTSWSEYWTKLEAAGESNTMPDIFWMHTDQILYYADFGILADLTDLYDEVDPNFWTEHYSQVSIGNASGSDGRMYGVPKDKDNVVLVYNMEMFDAAGVAYPDETWTWDDLMDASQKVYDATGKYGYMAYNDEQLGYWNFVYQNGGYILDPETNLHAGYTQPATADAIKYYVDIQKNEWCPDQTFFAETSPGTAFFSEMGCMFFEGSWNLLPELINYPNMVGKWDIAPLPKCPNPASGDGRGTISNGLCYATAANGKNLDVVKDVLRFFGSEEGQRIQGESGAAIPAYLGLEDSWTTQFQNYDYLINTQVCYDQFDSAVQYINNASRRKWKSNVADEMVKVYNGADLDAQLAVMQSIADQYVTD
ncbi:MAG: sugar ABC transporter substrate-binding protein [Lawsonibacter sp.]|jgi:multiple sugar transport system substrate-binding protein|nr:sugar ABC transporter substrate-binding protein [Lawsonibacter sp.]MCI8989205.1 sugar ABC transporter substrate-binding protein [Lawsonibacter sp.]MCI9267236.1 sugar ABC transporter substrate-binding protein [Lawsonibacter sp.]